MTAPFVSLVVPAWRDREALDVLLPTLPRDSGVEVIVALADEERDVAAALAPRHDDVRWVLARRGRGAQMNAGAAAARGDWLVFLHADTRLTAGWVDEVRRAAGTAGVVGGCFRFALDASAWQARVLEHLVAIRVWLFGLPYGDQALFVRRDVFAKIGGYPEWPIMEDVALVRRLRREGRLYRSPLPAVTSARRWERDGWLRQSIRNGCLIVLYGVGVPPSRLARDR